MEIKGRGGERERAREREGRCERKRNIINNKPTQIDLSNNLERL